MVAKYSVPISAGEAVRDLLLELEYSVTSGRIISSTTGLGSDRDLAGRAASGNARGRRNPLDGDLDSVFKIINQRLRLASRWTFCPPALRSQAQHRVS